MQKWFRDNGIELFMLAVKLLTATVTASDTWAVSHNVLYVATIDMIFAALWFIVAYGGTSKKLMAMRPVAVPLSISMYLSMIVIGWEAHHDFTAIVVRMAGLGMLLFDSYSFLVDFVQKRSQTAGKREQSRYERMMNRRVSRAIRRSGRRKQGDMNDAVGVIMVGDIPGIVAARMRNAEAAAQNATAITVNDVPDTTVSGWRATARQLGPGQEFDRQFVEAATGYRRTKAKQIIDYAILVGDVEEVGYGRYKIGLDV